MKPEHDEGAYVAEVVGQSMGSTSKDNPQFILRIRILGKRDPKNPQNYYKSKVQAERSIYRVFTEKTIDYVLQDLEYLGFEGDSYAQLDPHDPKHQSFVGMEIDVICTHKPDQYNAPREEWSLARNGGGSPMKQQASPEQLRQLDYMFGKRLKELRSDKPKATPSTMGRKPEPVAAGKLEIDDSDVPF